MNANAQAWVAALRSGEFTQAKNRLRVQGRFCCLGVACELYRRAHPGEAAWIYYAAHGEDRYSFNLNGTLDSLELSSTVMAWFGLRTPVGNISTKCLAEMNDAGKTFNEIADAIERNESELFE